MRRYMDKKMNGACLGALLRHQGDQQPVPSSDAASSPTPAVKLNGNRKVTGTLRGFDQFLNIVLDEAVDLATKESMGMIVVRGNSVLLLEPLERVA